MLAKCSTSRGQNEMEPKHLTELPIVFQIIAGAGLFFGTMLLAVGGWVWKAIKPKLPAALQPPPEPKDAVVLSAAIADSEAIRSLAGAITRLIEYMKQSDEIEELRQERLDEHMKDIVSELRSVKACLRERTIV
jgi:hypothetical protein